MNLSGEHIACSAAMRVNPDRLWSRLMAMAEIGRVGATGVNRAVFSAEDIAARRLLVRWGHELGMTASHDAIGNLFLRLEGGAGEKPALLLGSHLDSQPTGGRFDGVYGVLAGLEAVQALREHGASSGRPIEVVAWCNEEGGRFSPGAMGSQVFAGLQRVDELMTVRDAGGTVLKDALADTLRAFPEIPVRHDSPAPAICLEAHIEQGPCLEAAGRPVGVVTGIQGCQWLEVEVAGEAAHAGTTPHAHRRDAFVAAMELISRLRELSIARSSDSRFTVGRVIVEPNTPNTVPCRVVFTVDFRCPDPVAFDKIAEQLRASLTHGVCDVRVRELFRHAPVAFPRTVTRMVEEAAQFVGCETVSMSSGAFHDALFLTRRCPVGMVFVRCRAGISHNPEEYASPEDLAAGTRVLTRVVESCCSS